MRPLFVFAFAGGASLAAMLMAEGAPSFPQDQPRPVQMSVGGFGLGSGYQLSRLKHLETTLYHVEEKYVEPKRVRYEVMYAKGLQAIERRVPVTLFRREPGGSLLHVEIGNFRTVLEVEPIRNRTTLERELSRVAVLLEQNLAPDDIPDAPDGYDPYAEIEYALINGMLSTLDPHSMVLPPQDSAEMDVENEGEFGGLGITVVEKDGRLLIEYPMPDTPAARAGLRPGDLILRIDGETTLNMPLDDAVELLRGPVNTKVALEILRDEQTLEVALMRQTIPLHPVEGDLLEGAIGYIAIPAFHKGVMKDLLEELARLNRETGGMRGLILDLRGNPGGYLTQAVGVSDTFLDRGMIVVQVNGAGSREAEESAQVSGTQDDYPMVVLVNANSASASEIVAGALRNNDRAVIVGERTFGKGSVQNLWDFADQSKLKLTISKYLTPGDRSIQSVGIPADIELVPVVAEWRDGKQGDPFALVYWRDRVRREADLDAHLTLADVRVEEPAYSFRYLRPAEIESTKLGRPDLAADYQVTFARDLLLSAPVGRRGEMLAAADTIVARHRAAGEAEIERAFRELDIAWDAGPTPEQVSLDVSLDLGPDDKLIVGEEEHVTMSATNTGTEPLYRVVGLTRSDNDLLDGREFVLGRIDPGETATYTHTVRLGAGYPSETSFLQVDFRDASQAVVTRKTEQIVVQGAALPLLGWSWTVDDAVEGGDGDGVIDVGERLAVNVVVSNLGEGPTVEPFARVKNRAGKALDIHVGTLEPGVIEPGGSWSGRFEVQVLEDSPEPLVLELTAGDDAAYDYASIMGSAFYEYFSNSTDLPLVVGGPTTTGTRQPPVVQITRAPEHVVGSAQATVSGRVTDDGGVAWVMVFHGEHKIFFDGSGRLGTVGSVPFKASVALEPGANTLTVIAGDAEGMTTTRSVISYYQEPSPQARATPSAEGVP